MFKRFLCTLGAAPTTNAQTGTLGCITGGSFILNTVITTQPCGSISIPVAGIYIVYYFAVSYGASVTGSIYAAGYPFFAGALTQTGGNIYYTNGSIISSLASGTINLNISYTSGSGLQISSGLITAIRIA